jgi:hypothetical protein
MSILHRVIITFFIIAAGLVTGSLSAVADDIAARLPGVEDPSVKDLKEGTYYGYTVPSTSPFIVPTTLEIVKSNETTPTPGYRVHRAILKMTLGGFDSLEYTVQDYLIYTHKHFTLERNFDGNKHNVISLHDAVLSDDGVVIEGKIKSPFVGLMGARVKLIHRGTSDTQQFKQELLDLAGSRDMSPSISGEYEGKCDGKYKRIQLMAVKKGLRNGQLLNGFVIRGVHGTRSSADSSLDNSSAHNSNASYSGDLQSVTYNYFTNQVNIPELSKVCHFVTGALSCAEDDSCRLLKKSSRLDRKLGAIFPNSETTMFKDQLLDRAKDVYDVSNALTLAGTKINKTRDSSGLVGENIFGGWIKYENRNVGERVMANVDINNYVDPTTLKTRQYISFGGKILIGNGEFDKSPYIELKFNPFRLPPGEERPGRGVFIGDAFVMIVDSFSSDEMNATLIAKDYGRVGVIHVEKMTGPEDFRKLNCSSSPISGRFLGRQTSMWADWQEFIVSFEVVPSSLNSSEETDTFSSIFGFDLSGSYQESRALAVPSMSGSSVLHTGSALQSEKTFFDPFTRTFSGVFNNGSYIHGVFGDSGFTGFVSEPRGGSNDVEEMTATYYRRLSGN